MENAEFRKDIEIEKPERRLFISERVREVRRLRIVLASSVLVKVLETALHRQFKAPCGMRRIASLNVRQSAMRRDPFQQAQSNLKQLVRRFRLQAFVFQVLH